MPDSMTQILSSGIRRRLVAGQAKPSCYLTSSTAIPMVPAPSSLPNPIQDLVATSITIVSPCRLSFP
jgi:hypothetical protein